MKHTLLTFTLCLLSILHAHGTGYNLSYHSLPEVIPSELPKGAEFNGNFQGGVHYKDAGGSNFLIFSELWDKKHTSNSLLVYHYTHIKGTTRMTWRIVETSQKGCQVSFVPYSLQMLDLDGDGYQELSFMYQTPCAENTQETLQLVLHHKGTLYKMTGNGKPRNQGGSSMPDERLTSQNKLFLWFARNNWENFVTRNKITLSWSWAVWDKETKILESIDWEQGEEKSYHWMNTDGSPSYLPEQTRVLLENARNLSQLPTTGQLLILSESGIGTVNPRTKTYKNWIQFSDHTLLLTDWAWTEDGSKLAFISLNRKKYEQETRIFVLEIGQGKMTRKQRYDAPVHYEISDQIHAAAPQFDGFFTLRYQKRKLPGEIGVPQLQSLQID